MKFARQKVAFPPCFVPWLFEPIPYKVAYGGRGGAKSWAYAQALVIEAFSKQLKILCAREFQTSIRDSVHSVLRGQIDRLGLTPWFKITDTSIRCALTGSEFIFKGLHMNPYEIKSMEGLDRCWVEEAEAVSESSWETLLPTLRKDGVELWISFNPLDPDAPTYKRWVVTPPPEAKVVKVSWRDNPWFPEALERQRAFMERTDPDTYEHVWEGEPRQISEAVIFRNRFTVMSFEEPERVDRYFYGADFGFANDPSTLIRSYIHNNCLYITHEAYGVGVEINDLPALYEGGRDSKTGAKYDGVPGAKDWPIFGDSSRPETISYLRRQGGFLIEPADKWQGSVEDGIAHLKGFDHIYIHERCKNMASEARLYSYKVDKQNPKVVLPIVVDANNHCIARGELVTTARGLVPIEHVVIGDQVMTRAGWKRVYSARKISDHEPVMLISAGGKTLRLTGNHEVFVDGIGFVRADALRDHDSLLVESDNRLVPVPVDRTECGDSAAEVYDLSVEGMPEFVVGGILVHNCWDAVRYSLNGYIQRGGLGVWEKLAS